MALGNAGDWTFETLVVWLDRQIDHRDIPLGESAEFLRKVIRGLMTTWGISDLSVLALDRFRLRDEIEARIQQHRDGERKVAPGTETTRPRTTDHRTGPERLKVRRVNAPSSSFGSPPGGFQFKKHYFVPKPGELRETTPNGNLTEEIEVRPVPGRLARSGIRKLRLFGSVLRDDFDPARSEVDVLAEFAPGVCPGLKFFGYCLALRTRIRRTVCVGLTAVKGRNDATLSG